MTDLKGHFERILEDEPNSSDDVEGIVRAGRQARRRRRMVTALAGGTAAAAVTAVVVPVALVAGTNRTAPEIHVLSQPTPTNAPTAKHARCYYVIAGNSAGAQRKLAKAHFKVMNKKHGRVLAYRCQHGATPQAMPDAGAKQAAGPQEPRYQYTEDPAAISSRLGKHFADRIAAFGLTVNYTRPFAQETSTVESGHPPYFGGNADIEEAQGYGDIGVQVTHKVTTQVPANQSCDDPSMSNCTKTTLADGSTLETAEMHAGRGDIILTAEVHRPDGLVVQAQESNYPFGPAAGSETHGSQPLTLDQLVSLAEDPGFSF